MQYQLEEANRQLTEANKQLAEAQNLLEIEESNRTALVGLYAEWKAEGEAEIAALKQQLKEVSDGELVEWYDFLKWLKTWVESKPKKGQWTPTKADAEAVLQNVKKPKEPE